ncbi:hypothetical protein K9692_004704 [Escherichia coli]|nr:hypothetical protein [Escherichia coli]
MKPYGLHGKAEVGDCGCCWRNREDCPHVTARPLYRRRQRKMERQRNRNEITRQSVA